MSDPVFNPRYVCAVCGYSTLETDDPAEICMLCDWAVGQVVEAERRQPGAYSLDEAQANFQQHLTFRRPGDPGFGVETQPDVLAAKQALRAALDRAQAAEAGASRDDAAAQADDLAARLGRARGVAAAFAAETPEAMMISLGNLIDEKCQDLGLTWRALSPTERLVWFILGLDGQVNNGGFHQFFYNEEGEFALEVLPVLYKLGAVETAQLYEEALAVFPDGRPPVDQAARQEQLDGLSNEAAALLQELSHQYYDLAFRENLYELALPILRSRWKEFLR